ncbi:MAG TPA: TlyA family RNA methyltransferase [Candidatus Dormibacteraeota bacterium]|nr:TlyA family RNA methyltransferase [Candidatus Dormibacteraeota bacterium]
MKTRLDVLMTEKGLAPSRTMAQAMIMAGQVKIDGQPALKAGQPVAEGADISITEMPKYVSRAGDKLASVASELKLDFNGKIILDVGSSTGGFTDFALQNGAKKVYAVDVGTAQLAYKLRQDPRVVVMEKTDIRTVNSLPDRADIALVDASFISLTKILPTVAELISPDGVIAAMAKPQFEADKPTADKFKGVISDEKTRQEILSGLEAKIKADFIITASADSKITGAQGNRERFYTLKRNSTTSPSRIT